MRITQWGEYGVHFSAMLARAAQDGRAVLGAAEVAREQGIDVQYAQQIFQRLRKGGVVESVRGPQGGYRLARPAEQITLRDILIAAEGDTFEVICEVKPLGDARCCPSGNCALRPIWYDLKQHIDQFFDRYTLNQLTSGPNPLGAGSRCGEVAPVRIGGSKAGDSLPTD